jgi:hypothetical protein
MQKIDDKKAATGESLRQREWIPSLCWKIRHQTQLGRKNFLSENQEFGREIELQVGGVLL